MKCYDPCLKVVFIHSQIAVIAKFLMLGLILPLVFSFSEAFAQNNAGNSIQIGNARITPGLRLDYVTSNNGFRTSDGRVAVSGFVLSPSAVFLADNRLAALNISYNGNYSGFTQADLDYADHRLAVSAKTEIQARHNFSGLFEVNKRHQPIHTGQTSFIEDVPQPVVGTNTVLRGQYSYGAARAKGNIGFGVHLESEDFNTVLDITTGDANTEIRPYLFASLRLSNEFKILSQMEFSVWDFDEDRRDRTEQRLLAGIELATTSKTGGDIMLGVSRADYENSLESDHFVARMHLYYRPLSYSKFDFSYNRQLETLDDETDGEIESLVDNARLSWTHDWSARIQSVADFQHRYIDGGCPPASSSFNQKWGLEVAFEIKRWVTFGFGAIREIHGANLCDMAISPDTFDYEVSSYNIFMKSSF